MAIIEREITTAPPQTRVQPAWGAWVLSISIFVALAPVFIPLAILEVVMRGDEV